MALTFATYAYVDAKSSNTFDVLSFDWPSQGDIGSLSPSIGACVGYYIWGVDRSWDIGPCIFQQYQNKVIDMVGCSGWNLATRGAEVGTTIIQL